MQWHFPRTLKLACACVCVFCVCGSFYDTACISGYIAFVVWWLVNDELEGSWSGPSWTKKSTIQECAYYDENPASIAGVSALTLTLLTWRIWWAPSNVSKWQMGFNMAFKGLIRIGYLPDTDVEHYLLGDQFRNINFYGTERLPVPMRYPKSEITPSKKMRKGLLQI